jgi:hypothetical protein
MIIIVAEIMGLWLLAGVFTVIAYNVVKQAVIARSRR